MTCPDLAPLLAIPRSARPASVRDAIAAHAAGCRRCLLVALEADLDGAPALEPALVRAATPRRRRGRVIAAVAAALALAAGAAVAMRPARVEVGRGVVVPEREIVVPAPVPLALIVVMPGIRGFMGFEPHDGMRGYEGRYEVLHRTLDRLRPAGERGSQVALIAYSGDRLVRVRRFESLALLDGDALGPKELYDHPVILDGLGPAVDHAIGLLGAVDARRRAIIVLGDGCDGMDPIERELSRAVSVGIEVHTIIDPFSASHDDCAAYYRNLPGVRVDEVVGDDPDYDRAFADAARALRSSPPAR